MEYPSRAGDNSPSGTTTATNLVGCGGTISCLPKQITLLFFNIVAHVSYGPALTVSNSIPVK